MRFLGKRLPPLGTMVAFEAAARHQSFTLAAAELNLTQAAISRQIRLLEEDLGINLFLRANRAVTLTSEGRDLQHTVSFSLMHIANAAEQVRATGGRHRLNIATDKSINALWLMPRLHEFRQMSRTNAWSTTSTQPSCTAKDSGRAMTPNCCSTKPFSLYAAPNTWPVSVR